MKYRRSHYHHHHHHHHANGDTDGDHPTFTHRPDGYFKGTIRRLAETFNISFKLVVVGFVVLFLFTGFFAVLVFLVASHWVRYPQKYDDFFDTAFEKSRRSFSHMTGQSQSAEPSMANNQGPSSAHEDFDFSDLDRKFEDLKRRAGGMEEHVSSEDYKLNKALRDLKD